MQEQSRARGKGLCCCAYSAVDLQVSEHVVKLHQFVLRPIHAHYGRPLRATQYRWNQGSSCVEQLRCAEAGTGAVVDAFYVTPFIAAY